MNKFYTHILFLFFSLSIFPAIATAQADHSPTKRIRLYPIDFFQSLQDSCGRNSCESFGIYLIPKGCKCGTTKQKENFYRKTKKHNKPRLQKLQKQFGTDWQKQLFVKVQGCRKEEPK